MRGGKEEGEGGDKSWSGVEEDGGERMLQTSFRLVSLLGWTKMSNLRNFHFAIKNEVVKEFKIRGWIDELLRLLQTPLLICHS